MNTKSNSNAGSGCSSHDLLAVARWLTGDDTGVSSKFITAVWIAGQIIPSKWGDSTPSDAPDFGRCVRLLEIAPSIRDVFPVLREVSPVWAAYVDHWDELTALNNGTTGADWYPVVTGRMRDLRSSANKIVPLTMDDIRATDEFRHKASHIVETAEHWNCEEVTLSWSDNPTYEVLSTNYLRRQHGSMEWKPCTKEVTV